MRWKALFLALTLAAPAGGRVLIAQETPGELSRAPETPESKEQPTFRPIESNVIVNLPSVNVPREGTLTFP